MLYNSLPCTLKEAFTKEISVCNINTERGGLDDLDSGQTVPGIRRVSCVLFWLRPHSDRLPYGTSEYCSLQIFHGNLDTHMVFHLKRGKQSHTCKLEQAV